MGYLDPRELNDLIALAERGGIGKGVALTDCVAEAPDQLMYISGDELILLRDLGKVLLASCEGIIGWVERDHIKFDSLAGSSTPPRVTTELPKTILTEPSPTRSTTSSNYHYHQPLIASHHDIDEDEDDGDQLEDLQPNTKRRTRDMKRVSGPFELDSPQPSPSLSKDDSDGGFFEQQQQQQQVEENRESIISSTSSEAFGGLGGFMMGGSDGEDEHNDDRQDRTEELKDDLSPPSSSIITPHHEASRSSPNHDNKNQTPLTTQQLIPDQGDDDDFDIDHDEDDDFNEEGDSEWDIYDDYARESMYGPAKRMSLAIQQKRLSRAAKAASRIPSPLRMDQQLPIDNESAISGATSASGDRPSPHSDTFRLPSADKVIIKPRENGSLSPSIIKTNISADNDTIPIQEEDQEQLTPRLAQQHSPTTPNQTTFTKIELPSMQGNGRSVATELRLRIMREREKDSEKTESSLDHHHSDSHEDINDTTKNADFSDSEKENQISPVDKDNIAVEQEDSIPIVKEHHTSPTASEVPTYQESSTNHETDESAHLATPQPADIPTFATSPVLDSDSVETTKSRNEHSLLASPLPIDEFGGKIAEKENGFISSPNLAPRPPRNHSPNLSPRLPQTPWHPDSPSSPHSISATRQAVDAVRSVSDGTGKRPRGLTLVGRMEADLLGSKGPVPITFLVDGPGLPAIPPLPANSPEPIGLGLPQGRSLSRASSPHEPIRRATSPLASPILANEDTLNQASPFPPHPHSHPHPVRSATTPVPPTTQSTPIIREAEQAKPSSPSSAGVGRPRARNFSATVAKTLGVGKKDSTTGPIPIPTPPLSIKTSNNHTPPVPSINSPLTQPTSASGSVSSKKSFFGVGRKSSLQPATPPQSISPQLNSSSPSGPSGTLNESSTTVNRSPIPSTPSTSLHQLTISENGSTPSLGLPLPRPPLSARSSSFSFTSKSSTTSLSAHNPNSIGKLPKKVSSSSNMTTTTAIKGGISHKDFIEETIKAEGLDFELIQPKKQNGALLSPIEDNSPISPTNHSHGEERPQSIMTLQTQNSVNSLRPLPETDEWGFLKDKSPVPEIFQSRSQANDHRVIEQKWLSIISTPLPPNTPPPKKVRKLVLDAGVPSSLRGKVWAWFMANTLSARTPGLYQELIEHDKGLEDQRIDRDVANAYPDHSIFSEENSAGQQDLRLILRAYSNFAPSGYKSEMSLIAGALLIHCVAEDSFWLLSGLINTVLKDYYTGGKDLKVQKERIGLRIDSSIFMGLLTKEEPKLSKLFDSVGLHPISFLDKWFSQLFIRCLPWPTTLRVIDAVVSEGSRFLLIASLSILQLSKERLLNLQKNPTTILSYLQNLPQDSLLLPENFMKTCDQVKFDEKDYKKLRVSVEKEILG
ncbi:uncharacterized protein L201_003921 [Kwoniella dendrophila CBS 6074]|uniref:Rab-GAP TBC domain-containing protein n=1 Tax=Kwoniella dendrophila CBS 6074 TaxID=1295534 RepID=A0AAX4JW31_9TREE